MRNLKVEFSNNKPHQLSTWIKQIVVLLVFIGLSGVAQADWPIEFGNSTHEAVVDSVVDSQGNTIIVGRFNGSTSFTKSDGSELVLNGTALDDMYVAKFDGSGSFIWAQKATGTASVNAYTVEVDGSDNIYISGVITGGASDTASFSSISSARGNFLAKLDNNGNWLWANAIPSIYYNLGHTYNRAVTASVSEQGVYLTYFEYTGSNYVQRFRKYNRDGNLLWTYDLDLDTTAPTAATEIAYPVAMDVVSSGQTSSEIYYLFDRLYTTVNPVCGNSVSGLNIIVKLTETITIDPDTGNKTYGHTCDWASAVGSKLFYELHDGGDLKADDTTVYYGVQGRISAYGASNGLELWNYGANQPLWIPDPANNPNTSTTSIAIDAEKNVYISGVYNVVSIFEGDPTVTDHSKTLPISFQPTLYVAKFLSAEKKWAWVTTSTKPANYPVMDPFSMRTQIAMGPGDATVNLSGNFLGTMDNNVTVNSAGQYNGSMGTDDTGLERVLSSEALPSDGGLLFDGNDDYINLPGSLLNGLTQYAVSFDLLIEPTTPIENGWAIFSGSTPGSDNELLLYFSSATNLAIWEKSKVVANFDISLTGVTINDGNWHTLRLQRQAVNQIPGLIHFILYVDDKQYLYKSYNCPINCQDPSFTPLISDGGVFIGQEQDGFQTGFDPTQAFKGRLDNFTFMDIWLSSNNTNPLYGYDITSSTPGVIAHWNFNDPFIAGDNLGSANSDTYSVDMATIPATKRPKRVPGSSLKMASFMGPADGYSAIISSSTGKWLIPQEYTAGTKFDAPNTFGKPRIKIDGVGDNSVDVWTYFYWNESEQAVYLLRPMPGLATISWPTSADGTSFSPEPPITIAPISDSQRQFHIANTSANLEPAGGISNPDTADKATLPFLKFLRVEYASDNQLDNATSPIFNRGSVLPGQDDFVILHYLKVTDPSVPIDEANQASYFQYVYTREWQDSDVFTTNQTCIIGSPITNINHVSVNGENGIVITPDNVRDATGLNVFIDANGADAAYNLQSHLGRIIPVNKEMSADLNDEVVVAWSHSNTLGQAWAEQTLGYNCTWPTASSIQISDQQGSGELPPHYLNAKIYNQPDPTLPGFNPNEEHALINSGRAFALRNDLNKFTNLSDPYVLVKYQDGNDNNLWSFQVYSVNVQDTQPFSHLSGPQKQLYEWEAGLDIQPPAPLVTLPQCNATGQTEIKDVDPANPSIWQNHKGYFYAKAEGEFTAKYFYPLQEGFYYDIDNNSEQDEVVGTCVPWLDRLDGGTVGTPVEITYSVHWPDETPIVSPGETIFYKKEVMCALANGATLSGEPCNLPNFYNQISAKIIYDQTDPAGTDPVNSSVKIIDPLSARSEVLTSIAGIKNTFLNPTDGKTYFSDLPFHLRTRLSYDATNQLLSFKGWWDDSQLGDVHLLPNIMTAREYNRILKIASGNTDFETAVLKLYTLTRNPNKLSAGGYQVGLEGTPVEGFPNIISVDKPRHQNLLGPNMALTVGRPKGTGYITIAFGDHPSSPLTELKVLKIADEPNSCNVYRGNLWVVPSDNIFEEALTLRHTGDFAGDPDNIFFEWYYQQDENGQPNFAVDAPPPAAPWVYHAGLSGKGAVDLTIEGPGILTLSDNWFVMRYGGQGTGTGVGASTGVNVCDNDNTPSAWAGAPGTGPTRAMLATGWIKRVISGLNFFDQRFTDYHTSEINTLTSMIAQTGEPYSGPIPFNPSPENVNSVGLLEAYQTVFDRGQDLSINAGYNNAAANNQLLNVATRISDMYTMLGNEAYADAQDPTVGLGTDSELGSFASSIFTFQNQLDSPMEEELVLLRGRDGSHTTIDVPPVYNRLFWNFTQGDGAVAYQQSYNIKDQNNDGEPNETDARILYPQGHGDAWGHYLSSVKLRYKLLQEPNFTWIPRSESVLVAGVPVEVDYNDERKFIQAAAAKARAGTEIINLTYREKYVEAPAGQWQGYKDTNTDRAWGLDGWSRRAGQGAYFDWVTANAILPAVDPNPAHTGISKVDRTTVAEISLIASGFADIQAEVDKADAGLNPLGLAKNVVPFDIDPDLLLSPLNQDKTHFDQIAGRAQKALDNAMDVFNFASQQTQSLRAVQDDVKKVENLMLQQEQDFKHRLIEIFGYPYAGTMGAGKTYPSDYTGPDILHYMYVDSTATGQLKFPDGEIHGYYSPDNFGDSSGFLFPGDTFSNAFVTDNDVGGVNSAFEGKKLDVVFPVASNETWSFVAPKDWQQRRAPGEIQLAISDLLQAESQLKYAKKKHANLIAQIEDAAALVDAEWGLYDETLKLLRSNVTTITNTNNELLAMKRGQLAADRIGQIARDVASTVGDGFPKGIDDLFSVGRTLGLTLSFVAANIAETTSDVLEGESYGKELQLDAKAAQLEVDLHHDTTNVDLIERIKELEQIWRREALVRLEMFKQIEVVKQSASRVASVISKGQRLIEERFTYRVLTAANIQDHRYKDMTFRIFRNDALQKYRATFDLAARYVYLAAVAYDYETNLLRSDQSSGSGFLEDLVRQRTLGQVINGEPVAGTPGLADVMARLKQNFEVYRGQLGFNNPQVETNRFSLRYELFRKLKDPDDSALTLKDLSLNADWRRVLQHYRVDNLWDIPQFKRYMRPFTTEDQGMQPGLVIPFSTEVNFGKNFFGHDLDGGDSAYDPSNFATKIRAVGTWFSNYNGAALSNTPRVYLVPFGMDFLRSPSGDTSDTREWRVIDQKLPAPFPIGADDLSNPDWIPINDSLGGTYADIRRHSSFRAYHDSGVFDPAEIVSDSRLIGRSVWNDQWLLVIPGGTLLFNANDGLETLINGEEITGTGTCTTDETGAEICTGVERDGNGISDILLNFQTYGYSGN